jgi:hypothetical protein
MSLTSEDQSKVIAEEELRYKTRRKLQNAEITDFVIESALIAGIMYGAYKLFSWGKSGVEKTRKMQENSGNVTNNAVKVEIAKRAYDSRIKTKSQDGGIDPLMFANTDLSLVPKKI